jgi:hypothetical protein
MVLKYGIEIKNSAIEVNLKRITNQIYKLLPVREEGGDWEAPLQNLIYDIIGMKMLWVDQPKLFSLLCKLESLLTLKEENQFYIFRRLIFECLSLMGDIKECLLQ